MKRLKWTSLASVLTAVIAISVPTHGVAQEATASGDSATAAASADEEPEEPEEKQAAWQYDPYRIKVWVALDYHGALTPALLASIRERCLDSAEAVAFSTWALEVEAVPDAMLRADMVHHLGEITDNQFYSLAGLSTVRVLEPGKPPPRRRSSSEKDEEEQEDKYAVSANADYLRDVINQYDKIMLLSVKASPLGYAVSCREVDTVTRNFGLLHRRETRQRGMLPDHAFGVVYDAFRPIVRIQSVAGNGKDAEGLIRAGGLIEGPESPSKVEVNDALLPIVRTNDRLGQPKKVNGIRATEWSYLHVTERDGEGVTMRLHSALRGPLGGRGGSRVQRVALKVRPRSTTTTVRLVSKGRERPLSGYEIYSRHVTEKNDSVFVGLTNWNGEIEVGQYGEFPLRLLYIKNGGSLLAGIPLLPGHYEFQQAAMRDDEIRLQAEAFVRSMQNIIVDTVAQRQMMTTTIEKLVKEGDREAAREELAKYRKLATLTSVLDLLNRRKKDMITSDRRMQMQIDLMFQDTQELAIEYLDDKGESRLNRLVNPTSGGAASLPEAPPKKGPPPKAPPQKSPGKQPAQGPGGASPGSSGN